jgi:hypothetical protein
MTQAALLLLLLMLWRGRVDAIGSLSCRSWRRLLLLLLVVLVVVVLLLLLLRWRRVIVLLLLLPFQPPPVIQLLLISVHIVAIRQPQVDRVALLIVLHRPTKQRQGWWIYDPAACFTPLLQHLLFEVVVHAGWGYLLQGLACIRQLPGQRGHLQHHRGSNGSSTATR